MRKDNRLNVLHIIENASLIQEHMQGVSWAEFQRDKLLQAAMERWLIIIGEASKRLSERFTTAHPDVPWQTIRGLRNIVVHEYDNIDLTVVYDILTYHVPSLLQEMVATRDEGEFYD